MARAQAGETLNQQGLLDLSLGLGYSSNGHLAAQTWPQGLQVTYAPNALGQPTQAGTFATGVQYYPNGAVQQFVYGNGIVYQMQHYARLLPARRPGTGLLRHAHPRGRGRLAVAARTDQRTVPTAE